jgi:hypothetical protein
LPRPLRRGFLLDSSLDPTPRHRTIYGSIRRADGLREMSVNAASAARADTRCHSVLASGQQHAPARFHQSDCWIGARVPAFGATKCFKRFVKLGLKERRANRPSLQQIKARWLPVADPCARRCPIHRKTTTLVPTLTRAYRSIMSWLYMRIHPCETNPPIDPGLFVPWMAY